MDPGMIGRYDILSELGHGGMAIVYLARDPLVKRQVAIKVLPRQFTFDPQFRARFQQEAEVIAALEHPAIVPVHDFGEHEALPYIVMRYMPGGSLGTRLQNGPLPVGEINRIFQRLGPGVDYAHRQGIIHRDIKPGNILFDALGEAYLSDFGIAKISEATAAYTGTTIVGTPEYMSPEQARGDRQLDGRSDVYSLGVVLYHCLTGKLPYQADTPIGTAVAHINDPIPNILEERPDLPGAWSAVIVRAMAKDPAERYPRAADLAHAITQAAEGAHAATMLEAVPETLIEDRPPQAAGGPVFAQPPPETPGPDPNLPGGSITESDPPAPRQRRKSNWLLAGGTLAALFTFCLLLAVTVGFLTGILPNPFGRQPPSALVTTPSTPAQAALPVASPTSGVTPIVTQVQPVGLSTTYIEYILDASGSMLETMEGRTRLEVAQGVLAERLRALPPGAQVGLRVYGHRIPFQQEAESCEDIELVVPIQSNGAGKIVDWLPQMQAQGMTPMSESIRLAAEDFTFEPGRKNIIILLSDGIETCGDDPADVVRYLQEIGIDFTIHVIGMALDGDARAQLQRLAEVAGGVYHDVNSEADLQAALDDLNRRALEPPMETEIAVLTDSPPTSEPAVTAAPVPEANVDATAEGALSASTIYSDEYPVRLAMDGDRSTSWFSAGPDSDGTTGLAWTGARDDLIASIQILSNKDHDRTDFRTGFGFGTVVVQVLDAVGDVAYEETIDLSGTPDPDVTVRPGVVGRTVLLIFSGHEDPTCGGISELQIGVFRPEANFDATSEGTVEASTEYSSEFPAHLSVDGDSSTSWFSAGPGSDSTTTFTWTGAQDDLIASIAILSNKEHARPDFRTGFGFGEVVVQVLDGEGEIVYEEAVDLPGTPDPDMTVRPGVVGRSVVLIFSGHEDPTCGGISELQIGVVR